MIQFRRALESGAYARDIMGPIDHVYAYGISQTASALLEILHGPQGQGLFDLTVLHVSLWRPPFSPPGVFDFIEGSYSPVAGVGRVMFIGTEGDQLVSEAEDFERATADPDYRVYEVAGAAHQPSPLNPLDHFMVMRASFEAGDRWVREGKAPPRNAFLKEAYGGEEDPVYGFFTGIARDRNLNARGGVQLPDVRAGRAQFIAADFSIAPLPGLFGLLGATIDLACTPQAGQSEKPRFKSQKDYVKKVESQVKKLVKRGFLLEADGEALIQMAIDSGVGTPSSCPTP